MIRERRLEFIEQGGVKTIRCLDEDDVKLVKNLNEFCDTQLAKRPVLTSYAAVVVTYDDQTMEVTGLAALQFSPDIQVFRSKPGVTAKASTLKLIQRLNGILCDMGLRGAEAMVYLSSTEPTESRCDSWKSWLSAMKAKPADRYLVEVK